MDLRETLDRKLQTKRKELVDLEAKVRECATYIKALEDVIRVADVQESGSSDGEPNIRPDSDVGRTRDVLKNAGRPLHIDQILKEIGRPVEKRARASLASTLANYVRKEVVFTRPGPNTFGLAEFGQQSKQEAREPKPPDDFGTWEEPPQVADDDMPF